MKKFFILLTAMLIVFSSCEQKTKAVEKETLLTQFVCAKKTQGDNSYFIQMDMPVQGARPLLDSLRAFLLDDAQSMLYYAGDDSIQGTMKTQLPTLGDTVSCDMQAYMDSLVNFYVECFKDYPHAYFTTTCRIVACTPKYVSYTVDGGSYTGGAHGIPWSYGKTFDAETGEMLTWADIFKAGAAVQLEELISESLQAQYYYQAPPCYMQENMIFQFALPSLSPVLMSQGIKFFYGVYEIGPYIEGMPHCTIPYDRLQEFMTDDARAMVGI